MVRYDFRGSTIQVSILELPTTATAQTVKTTAIALDHWVSTVFQHVDSFTAEINSTVDGQT
jgi:hypothetical protein